MLLAEGDEGLGQFLVEGKHPQQSLQVGKVENNGSGL